MNLVWPGGGGELSSVQGRCTLGTDNYSRGVTRHDVGWPGLKMLGVKQKGGNFLPGYHTAGKCLSHCSLVRPSGPRWLL